jgi:hypothetical protein
VENATPYEIIMAPFEAWIAPVATAFPDVDEVPAGPWAKIGTSGDENYLEEGVTVEHSETLAMFRGLGRTGIKKMTRTEEDVKIRFTLADLSLEQYKIALNGNSITTTPAALGVPGTKKIGLTKGTQVTKYALIVRGPSPYMADGLAQFCVPICAQSGKPQPVFRKNEPAALALEFTAIDNSSASDDSERYGYLIGQTGDALT